MIKKDNGADVSDDDPRAVLMEFFQRNVERHKHITGIPRKFEVQTETQMLDASPPPTPIRTEDGFTPKQQALAPPAPTVTSVTPNAGPPTGAQNVAIVGTNFIPTSIVKFGGNLEEPGGTFTDAQHINAITPVHIAAVVDIDVINADGNPPIKGTLVNGYTYVALTVTACYSNNGRLSGGSLVTIIGTGFNSSTTVKFGTHSATNVVIINAQGLTCHTPPGDVGWVAVDVSVTNQNPTQLATLPNAFTYVPAPTIISVNPTGGPGTGGNAVIVTGTGFDWTPELYRVYFGVNPNDAARISSTELVVGAPAHALGVVDVTVMQPDTDHQTSTLVNGYTYGNPPPSIAADEFYCDGDIFLRIIANQVYTIHISAYNNGVFDPGFAGPVSFDWVSEIGFHDQGVVTISPSTLNFVAGRATCQITGFLFDSPNYAEGGIQTVGRPAQGDVATIDITAN